MTVPRVAPSAADPRLAAMAVCLKQSYGAERVILFGSVARGEATEHSDVDLLVVAATVEPYLQRQVSVLRLLDGLSRGLALAPIVLTPDELQQRLQLGDQFFHEIVQTGREL